MAIKHSGIASDSIAHPDTLNAVSIFKSSKNDGKNLFLMAYVYEKSGCLSEAETYYRQAWSMDLKLNNKVQSANTALRLSDVLYQNKKYKEGLVYAHYAVKSFQSLGSKDGAASAYLTLALISHKLGIYGEAENYLLKQALPLFRSAGNVNGRLHCFANLGHIYLVQKRYSEAKWFFIQQNTLARSLKDTSAIVSSLLYLAKVKMDIRDYDIALTDVKEAELLAEKIGLSVDIQEYMIKIYDKMGEPMLVNKFIAGSKAESNYIEGDGGNAESIGN